jgi:hypothetical protein
MAAGSCSAKRQLASLSMAASHHQVTACCFLLHPFSRQHQSTPQHQHVACSQSTLDAGSVSTPWHSLALLSAPWHSRSLSHTISWPGTQPPLTSLAHRLRKSHRISPHPTTGRTLLDTGPLNTPATLQPRLPSSLVPSSLLGPTFVLNNPISNLPCPVPTHLQVQPPSLGLGSVVGDGRVEGENEVVCEVISHSSKDAPSLPPSPGNNAKRDCQTPGHNKNQEACRKLPGKLRAECQIRQRCR